MKIANREIDDALLMSYVETVKIVRESIDGKRNPELIGVYNEIRIKTRDNILKQANVSRSDIEFTIRLAEFVDSVL